MKGRPVSLLMVLNGQMYWMECNIVGLLWPEFGNCYPFYDLPIQDYKQKCRLGEIIWWAWM